MKQTPRQPINEFLSGMQSIWDQMEQSTHIVKDPANAAILATKRDQFHLIQFLMALTSEFEPVRATLLQQAHTLQLVILVLFPPLHCLYLTHILFPTSLLISSLLVNYVNLVLTYGLVLLVVVCRSLGRIRFLGQAVEWDGCSSSLHFTYLPHRHPLRLMLLILLLFFL